MKLKQFLSIPLLFLPFSTSIYASDRALDEAIYTLVDGVGSTRTTNIFSGTDASQGIMIDGINVKVSVSAWSDTGSKALTYDFNTNTWDEGTEDESVKEATLVDYTNCSINSYGNCISGTRAYGYGMTNQDQVWYNNSNGNYVPWGDSHSVDNFNDHGSRDFDMILLSFDQEVVLTGGTFSANYHDGGEENDVTVAGLDYNSANALFTGTSDFTWSDVSDTVITGALGHFDISETKNSENYYESSFTKNLTAAKYWLVGAYNTVFDQSASGSINNVGFKLSSLTVGLENETTLPPTEVSEPGALALMSLGLGLVLYRRKRRV
ncbi:exosortase-dependent surface protein XDP1 [Alteromonas sp. KUL150]|uniref:exosortase-dependent surface protein XDP1 n=1 Tax=unclassified Alteromonas TaxID=2614992 RepID=UPI0012E43575|nr:exosortase-dependent surface protein XDP1 [Alteromonas sp. KUL150]GFD74253.1 hypothetical protein KUL113_36730 [Tenacibaculum sp. KUL113]GFD87304.1 hypothetical protein KUL150_33630 [Alteromonas sp. KUL150]|tara:strand:- start:273 stop:1238 length:966 start_codon:yes stop_codon:yes gene_type:complete